MDEPTYTVTSGYDGRVIATGLTRQQRDDLIDRICRRMDDHSQPPRWKQERKDNDSS